MAHSIRKRQSLSPANSARHKLTAMPTMPTLTPNQFNRAAIMAPLHIRNLPDPVHARLRLRAAKSRRSMEAEARTILADACKPEVSDDMLSELQNLVGRLYGDGKPANVVEALISERRREAEQERL